MVGYDYLVRRRFQCADAVAVLSSIGIRVRSATVPTPCIVLEGRCAHCRHDQNLADRFGVDHRFGGDGPRSDRDRTVGTLSDHISLDGIGKLCGCAARYHLRLVIAAFQ